jgi:hypothetical protein
MAINKFTRPSFNPNPEHQADDVRLFAQRVGESGLSQTLSFQFDGFTASERVAITDLVDQALQARIDSMGAIG